ncbi:hypothetical protein M422DRAFT_197967 [Sphaerobolus stellatus SS14]|nr:hypothetical protein M422DRAFT_197967 [Sphaerobolus stellatus SS14]
MTVTKGIDSSSTVALTIAMEYANISSTRQHCPSGIYIIPSESIYHWDGVLFVHQGYYADSVLKFRLTFPRNFPENPPRVNFATDVFHPLISQKDGLFNLSPQFRHWKSKEHHVFHILHCIKAAFKRAQLDQLEEKDCLNPDAFRLYRDATPSFAALAAQTAALSNSKSALYDKDHPSMTMRKYDGLPFTEIDQTSLQTLREKLGVEEWKILEDSDDFQTASQS